MAGTFPPAVLEWQQELKAPVFIPRLKATDIPSGGAFEGVTRCVSINTNWIPHILGVLEALDQPDTWIGTESEINAARDEIREIMLAFQVGVECEVMPPIYLKEVVGCENGVIEFTRVVDNEEESIFLDVGSCIPQLPHVVTSIASCESGVIEIESIDFGVPQTAYLNMSVCLDGEFARPGDIPTITVPVPSIIGDDLWFDMDGDSDFDLNVGRVVGFNGSDGNDGDDAPIPDWEIIDGDLWVDKDADGLPDENLGRVVGLDGAPGICETCDPVPAPEQADEPGNDGLMCSIAIQEAAYVRRIWDKAYADSDGIVSGFIGGVITGAGVLSYFFPGAAVVGALAGLFLTVVKGITDLESNIFDDDFEEEIRCMLYCILQAENTTVMTEAIRTAWVAEILAFGNVYQDYAGQLLEVVPLEELKWIAYASPEIDEEACAECDCEPETGNCIEVDFIPNNGTWTAGNAHTQYAAGGWRIPAGSDDTLNINSTARYTGQVVSVTVTLAAPIRSDSRLYIQRNNGTKTLVATGGGAVYNITGLTYNMTNQLFGITVDYHPTSGASHPQIVQSVEFCFLNPPIIT